MLERELRLEQDEQKRQELRRMEIAKRADQIEAKTNKKIYKGKAAYQQSVDLSLLTSAQGAAAEGGSKAATVPKAPTTVRNTCRFDYHKGLCKDWHDAGYCIFGDSCIYMHDRGDYKTGWELEKDWENM
jgi:RING finger protein 113A